jgi:uncharacterized protein YjbI with pentapeptide repeats
MASDDHIQQLLAGVNAWNKWRLDNPWINPDLSGANLSGRNFNRESKHPNSINIHVLPPGLDLTSVNLSNADISRSEFVFANFWSADLRSVAAAECEFGVCSLEDADLRGADLSHALIEMVVFSNTQLDGCRFTHARIQRLQLANLDLSGVIGLESVVHLGPSSVGLDTILRSRGRIPRTFLAGCGVPNDILDYVLPLVAELPPISFYSSFISHSSADHEFAVKLYTDLMKDSIRCWLATENLAIGAPLRSSIDSYILNHERVILVLSNSAITSQWVEQEVETSLKRERSEQSVILFPICIDATITTWPSGWPAYLRNTRNIGDFTGWRNPAEYTRAYRRLKASLSHG